MLARDCALHVVPPVAREEFLAEYRAVWAQERILPSAHVADVKHLSGEEKVNHPFYRSCASRAGNKNLRHIEQFLMLF